jgi:Holliday junction resolvase RusA-like endonuclease
VLTFFIPGDPKPQGSKRGFVTKHGKVALVEQAGKPLKNWRNTITLTATRERINSAWEPYTSGPIGIELVFGLHKPIKPKYPVPAVRPDIDKLVRSVLDGLTDSHLWQDDSQVIELIAKKTYNTTGVQVTVWKIP